VRDLVGKLSRVVRSRGACKARVSAASWTPEVIPQTLGAHSTMPLSQYVLSRVHSTCPCAPTAGLCHAPYLVLRDAVQRQKSMTSSGQWWRRSSRDGGMPRRVRTCESIKRSARSQRRWRRSKTMTGLYIQHRFLDFSHPLSPLISLVVSSFPFAASDASEGPDVSCASAFFWWYLAINCGWLCFCAGMTRLNFAKRSLRKNRRRVPWRLRRKRSCAG